MRIGVQYSAYFSLFHWICVPEEFVGFHFR